MLLPLLLNNLLTAGAVEQPAPAPAAGLPGGGGPSKRGRSSKRPESVRTPAHYLLSFDEGPKRAKPKPQQRRKEPEPVEEPEELEKPVEVEVFRFPDGTMLPMAAGIPIAEGMFPYHPDPVELDNDLMQLVQLLSMLEAN